MNIVAPGFMSGAFSCQTGVECGIMRPILAQQEAS